MLMYRNVDLNAISLKASDCTYIHYVWSMAWNEIKAKFVKAEQQFSYNQ
jgi:hypothetical protein